MTAPRLTWGVVRCLTAREATDLARFGPLPPWATAAQVLEYLQRRDVHERAQLEQAAKGSQP